MCHSPHPLWTPSVPFSPGSLPSLRPPRKEGFPLQLNLNLPPSTCHYGGVNVSIEAHLGGPRKNTCLQPMKVAWVRDDYFCIPYLLQVDPGLRGSRETIKIVVYNLSRRRLISCIAHAGVGWHPLRVSRILVTLIHIVPIPQGPGVKVLIKSKTRLAPSHRAPVTHQPETSGPKKWDIPKRGSPFSRRVHLKRQEEGCSAGFQGVLYPYQEHHSLGREP